MTGKLGSFMDDLCVERGPKQMVLKTVSSNGVLARWLMVQVDGQSGALGSLGNICFGCCVC